MIMKRLVLKLNSIRVILSVIGLSKMYLQQFDIKTAFLYGEKLIYKVICSNRRDTKMELTMFTS